MNVGKKNIILAIVLCVSITVIGVSFAYFTSGVSVTGEGAKASMTPGDMLKVEYDAGEETIHLENAIPGTKDEKNFSVTITPTQTEKAVTYAINLEIDENTFETCDSNNQTATNMCTLNSEELTYDLKDNSGMSIASGNLTEKSGTITLKNENKTVDAQTVLNYTLVLEYKNTGADQNHNANKKLNGKIKVVFAEEN